MPTFSNFSNIKQLKQTYIIPVSGDHFPLQLASIYMLTKALESENVERVKPKVILGSSGGVVASTIAMSGAWTTRGIRRVIKNMYGARIFRSISYGDIIPINLLVSGTAYTYALDVDHILENLITGNYLLKDTELIIGTYDLDNDSYLNFSSKHKEESEYKTEDRLSFCDSERTKLLNPLLATFSLPYILPPINHLDHILVDGGIYSPSPFTPLSTLYIESPSSNHTILFLSGASNIKSSNYILYPIYKLLNSSAKKEEEHVKSIFISKHPTYNSETKEVKIIEDFSHLLNIYCGAKTALMTIEPLYETYSFNMFRFTSLELENIVTNFFHYRVTVYFVTD
jgi:predicted acylesterase/phospholipase RssA